MGMFDYIKFEMDCPKCGVKLDNFQSKDGSCSMIDLEYWEVDRFYDMCDKCNAWIEFNRKTAHSQIPITDYEMSVRE